MQGTLKQIVIVGGGAAGWMTAAALSRLLKPHDVSITLVESDEIGIIGVGEATIPDMLQFNLFLGIVEAELMRATQATFKLGIEFVDWSRKGARYFHPFGFHGVDIDGVDFHQYWLQCRAKGHAQPIGDYCLTEIVAQEKQVRFPRSQCRRRAGLLSALCLSFRRRALCGISAPVRRAARRQARRRQGLRSVAGAGNRQHHRRADWPTGRRLRESSSSIARASDRCCSTRRLACPGSIGGNGCPATARSRWRVSTTARRAPTRVPPRNRPGGNGRSRRSTARATVTSSAASS